MDKFAGELVKIAKVLIADCSYSKFKIGDWVKDKDSPIVWNIRQIDLTYLDRAGRNDFRYRMYSPYFEDELARWAYRVDYDDRLELVREATIWDLSKSLDELSMIIGLTI